jgi:hypothetical protein
LSGRYAVPEGVSCSVFGLVPSSLAGVLCLAGMLYQREDLVQYLDRYGTLFLSRCPLSARYAVYVSDQVSCDGPLEHAQEQDTFPSMYAVAGNSLRIRADSMYLVMYSVPKLACTLAHFNPNPPHTPPPTKGEGVLSWERDISPRQGKLHKKYD